MDNEEFYVADLTIENLSEAQEFIGKVVIPEADFCRALQIHTKENAMKVLKENFQKLIMRKTSLGCFKKETCELVGLNILAVKNKVEDKSELNVS